MSHIKLADRKLPDYTKGEEVFNYVTHIVGGGFGVLLLIACVGISAYHTSVVGALSALIYGASVIMLYTISSVYHGLNPGIGKKVLQVIDHCTIYFMIAGTYTPILMCRIIKDSPVAAWLIFALVWGLTALAVTLTAIDLIKYQIFSQICYIFIGWAAIFIIPQTIRAVGTAGFSLIVSGGILYTIGAVIYGIGKKVRYMHSVFHIFVLLGSFTHAIAIIWFVL